MEKRHVEGDGDDLVQLEDAGEDEQGGQGWKAVSMRRMPSRAERMHWILRVAEEEELDRCGGGHPNWQELRWHS